MKVSGQYDINFGAKFISKANIKEYDTGKRKYKDSPASFVELDPRNKNDVNSVSDAVYYWNNDLYGSNIAYNLKWLSNNAQSNTFEKIYAITTQDKEFGQLNPDKIEALAQVFETNKRVRLVYLQVNPELVYSYDTPEYKHVGKSMIDNLKDIYHDRSIILNPSSSAKRFYEKQGFEHCDDGENHMIWNKEAEQDYKYKDEYW
ncbi:MAG: GNAT family N-acetyltransferase [Cyanobacteria bacterium RUI128]|nr:GNAT family N-acetyltransferase [Cyanobacteria bacterium RUI128]